MTDYISREEAYNAIVNNYYKDDQLRDLDAIPAADVRPVVTCGKCKYWELSKIEPSLRVCTYVCGAIFVRKAEDFCSRGEKREES